MTARGGQSLALATLCTLSPPRARPAAYPDARVGQRR